MTAPILEVRALRCERDDRLLFEDLSFRVEAGAALQLRGANGSGKTTLLRGLAGLLPGVEGAILRRGEDRSRSPARLGEGLVLIGHRPGLSASLTAADNLRWWASIQGWRADADVIARALGQVGLAGHDLVPPRQMSAGQQRRVSLARLALALAHPGNELWLLDEPLTALDTGGQALVVDLMSEHQRQGGAVVFSTHQPVAGISDHAEVWLGAREQAA